MPGVRHVARISSGVAVIADGYHAATKGRAALVVTWDKGKNANNSSAAIARQMREAAMVAAFAYVGVDAPHALALSVAFGLVQIAIGLPGGVWWFKSGAPAQTDRARPTA